MEIITNNNELGKRAIDQLRHVIDPEMGLNIIDLGLIYQLDFDELKRKLYVNMTLTTRFCPMGEAITTGVRQAMEMEFLGYDVQINLTFDQPWKPENISEEGRKYLEQ